MSRQKSIQAFCQDTYPTVPSSPSGANQRSVCAGKTRSSGTSKLWPQGRSEGCAACDELLDDGQDIVLTDNYVLHVLQGHLGAGILAGDDLIARLHGHGDFLAVYHAAGAHGNDLSHRGLLLCGAGEDEPTAGMDAFSRRQMWNLLKKLNQQKLTILLTTHYMEEAETLCDRVGFMCGGRLEETDAPGHMIEMLGRYAVDETSPDGLKSHYFHGKEEAIQYLSASEQETALRSTTLEDVFLETIGQQLECR